MSPNLVFIPEHSQITVGIVTYNSADHIIPCLESVIEHLSDALPTIIVLDNASSDSTIEKIKEFSRRKGYPVKIIPEVTNHGFAWGVNRICEIAHTHWICLINPDAKLLTNFFQYAREIEKRIPNAGPVGGVIIDPNGNPQECGGVFPTPSMALWDWCGLRKLFPRKNWSTTLKWKLDNESIPKRIDYPTGAFWLFRREVYQRVGAFDERFFLYFEETDFCKRAMKIGWPSFIHPKIKVEHIRGASFKFASPHDPLSIYFESLIKYLYKHFPKHSVDASIWTIGMFFSLRQLLFKDEKSTRVKEAFLAGKSRASNYSQN